MFWLTPGRNENWHIIQPMNSQQVRFTVFKDISGWILAYCAAPPFVSPNFSDGGRQACRFESEASLRDRLREIGLPEAIANNKTSPIEAYMVTDEQLSALGFEAILGE